MNAQRESCIFYRSFYEAIKELPLDIQGQVYSAVFEFAMNGNELDLTGVAKSIFLLIKPQITANLKRYENSKKGGRPAQNAQDEAAENTDKSVTNIASETAEIDNQTATEVDSEMQPTENQNQAETKPNCNRTVTKPQPKLNQTVTEGKPNVNVNVNDNVNVNVNDNYNANVNVNKNQNANVNGGRVPWGIRKGVVQTPTQQEVFQYCREIQSRVPPQRFYEYYTARGWSIAGRKIIDWRALLRSWQALDEQKEAAERQKMASITGFPIERTPYSDEELAALFMKLDDEVEGVSA